jgi:hypothetical protein
MSSERGHLLCTFVAEDENIENLIDKIQNVVSVYNNSFFYFEALENPKKRYITYNILKGQTQRIPNTILIHRNKSTNTLYTVNAINRLTNSKNQMVDWNEYRNSLVLVDKGFPEKIELNLMKKFVF